MLKCKIFSGSRHHSNLLEENVNRFLEENKDITLVHVVQDAAPNGSYIDLTLTIFYKE